MKKIAVTALAGLILLITADTALHARQTRVGLGFGLPNAVLVFRPVPWEVKAGYDFTAGKEYVFASLDYRFVNSRPIVEDIHISLGIGAYTKLLLPDDDSASVEGGIRFPFGVQYLLLNDFLELFLQISPGLDFYPKPGFSNQPVQVWLGFTVQVD